MSGSREPPWEIVEPLREVVDSSWFRASRASLTKSGSWAF
jgi:hypothetical protein